MQKHFKKVGLCVLMIVSVTGVALADKLVSSSVPFFPDGMTLDAGTTYHGSTLTLVFGSSDPLEQPLPTKPGVHFEYDPEMAGQLVVMPENILGIAVVKDVGFDEINDNILKDLQWSAGAVTISEKDIVVLRTSDNTYIKFGNTSRQDSTIQFDYQQLQFTSPSVPEPGTLGLVCIGIFGAFAACRMTRRR